MMSSSSSSSNCIQPDSNYKITSGRNRKRFCLIKHLTNHYLPYEDYDSVQAHRLLQECTPGSYLIRKVIHRYPNDDRVYVSYVVCVRESNWYPHAVTQTLIKNCGNHFKFMDRNFEKLSVVLRFIHQRRLFSTYLTQSPVNGQKLSNLIKQQFRRRHSTSSVDTQIKLTNFCEMLPEEHEEEGVQRSHSIAAAASSSSRKNSMVVTKSKSKDNNFSRSRNSIPSSSTIGSSTSSGATTSTSSGYESYDNFEEESTEDTFYCGRRKSDSKKYQSHQDSNQLACSAPTVLEKREGEEDEIEEFEQKQAQHTRRHVHFDQDEPQVFVFEKRVNDSKLQELCGFILK